MGMGHYTTHPDLFPCLGFKVRVVGYTWNDVHFRLVSVHLSLEEPVLPNDSTTVVARLLKHLPDSCVNVVLSLLQLAFGESPCGGRRVTLDQQTLRAEIQTFKQE